MSTEIERMIRVAGQEAPAPSISPTTIAGLVKARQERRRRFANRALFGLVAIAIGGSLSALWVHQHQTPARVESKARPELQTANLRPACPPDQGTVTLTEPASGPGRFGPTVKVGRPPSVIGLTLRVPSSTLPDRYITEAQFIMVNSSVAQSDGPPGHVFDNPKYQVAKTSIARPREDQQVSLTIPAGTASGSYAIYYEAYFPGPSLCGQDNPNPPTTMGSGYAPVATVIVP